MKKMIYIASGVVVVILVGFLAYKNGLFNNGKNSFNKENAVYLKHFNKKDSNLFVGCNQDSDCKLVALTRGCVEFDSINKNNSMNDINKFNTKESKLIENITFDCARPSYINHHNPVCKNNLCDVELKNK